MPIESEIKDGFLHSRYLSDRIEVADMIGSLSRYYRIITGSLLGHYQVSLDDYHIQLGSPKPDPSDYFIYPSFFTIK